MNSAHWARIQREGMRAYSVAQRFCTDGPSMTLMPPRSIGRTSIQRSRCAYMPKRADMSPGEALSALVDLVNGDLADLTGQAEPAPERTNPHRPKRVRLTASQASSAKRQHADPFRAKAMKWDITKGVGPNVSETVARFEALSKG